MVDELIGGEVVVLCGAGISAPQLELFQQLTQGVFKDLSVDMTPGEAASHKDGRYEEVLGALARRLADPSKVEEAVRNRLQKPDGADLSQHETLLRLSRDVENRSTIVTTNFETLLEHAHKTLPNSEAVNSVSFAGQSLPAPGSRDFHGIIHLHGRLDDQELGLRKTPLVLTSSDYGEAYMRSGWASRFLFDLSRCRTILLVGYSAGDAPVRYFLNVLEADRSRFSDLRRVYALASYEADPSEVHKQWTTLGVEPIPYPKLMDGHSDHYALWRGLSDLADLAERPQKRQKEIISDILSNKFDTSSDDQRAMIKWLLKGKSTIWDCVIGSIEDAEWFEFIRDNKLCPDDIAARIVAFWLAKDFQCPKRYAIAVDWLKSFGEPLVRSVQERLLQSPNVEPEWHTVWRQFCRVSLVDETQKHLAYRRTDEALKSDVVLDSDIVRAVDLLTPRLRLSPRLMGGKSELSDGQAVTVSNLCNARIKVGNSYQTAELIRKLVSRPELALRVVEIASAQLRAAVAVQVEIGQITDTFDLNDTSVPSIEEHEQNRHRDGVLSLVRLIADSFPAAVKADWKRSQALAHSWMHIPGNVGYRLYLHVARTAGLFSSNDAMEELLQAESERLWSSRREVALFIRDRASEADRSLVARLEDRLLTEAPVRFKSSEGSSEGADWRPLARDRDLWIYLSMYEKAGVLSDLGRKELEELRGRREFLNRKVEERDLFYSFSSGVERIVGREEPIRAADPEVRLQVAHEMQESFHIEDREGWGAFCRSDPIGALQALKPGDFSQKNLTLWNEFLSIISFSGSKESDQNFDVVEAALQHLEGRSCSELAPLSSSLASILFHRRRQLGNLHEWWWKVWPVIGGEEILDTENLIDSAINTASGKLAEIALDLHSIAVKSGSDAKDSEEMLSEALGADGSQGTLASAILVRNTSYLLHHCEEIVAATLEPRLRSSEASAIRSVFIRDSKLSPQAFSRLRDVVIRSISECSEEPGTYTARNVAAQVLRPALSLVENDGAEWGVTTHEITSMLRACPNSVRTAVVDVLTIWAKGEENNQEDESSEEFCDTKVIPFFQRFWPKEAEFVDEMATPYFLRLLELGGSKAEHLFSSVQPFIAPYQFTRVSLTNIPDSDLPSQAPELTLRLLWHVLKETNEQEVFGLTTALDSIAQNDPSLEIDRRFQQLEKKAFTI